MQPGFVHIPKTGGSSIAKGLRDAGYRWPWHGTPHVTAREIAQRWDGLRGCFLFTVIRHPWARLVSGYHHGHRAQPADIEGFRAWVREPLNSSIFFRPQIDFLVDRHGDQVVPLVFRFEQLPAAWERIRASVDGLAELPHVNVGDPRPPWQDYYDTATYQAVEEVVEPDLRVWSWA